MLQGGERAAEGRTATGRIIVITPPKAHRSVASATLHPRPVVTSIIMATRALAAALAAGSAAFGPLTASAAAAAPLTLIPARSELVRISGRRLPWDAPASLATPYAANVTGPIPAVAVDWEGTSLDVWLRGGPFVGLLLQDGSALNSRWSVFIDNMGLPGLGANISLAANGSCGAFVGAQGAAADDVRAAELASGGLPEIPGVRTSVLVTSSYQTLYPLISSGSSGAGLGAGAAGTRVRVTLMDEPAFIEDSSPAQALVVAGFVTDGEAVAPPALPAAPLARRSLLVLGDSLTAGYGAGSDAPLVTAGSNAADVLPCGGGACCCRRCGGTYHARVVRVSVDRLRSRPLIAQRCLTTPAHPALARRHAG